MFPKSNIFKLFLNSKKHLQKAFFTKIKIDKRWSVFIPLIDAA